MKIERVVLRQLRMPLVHFFETSFSRTYERQIVIVEVVSEGLSGWGEITAGEHPFYNEEWTEAAWIIARDYVAPRVLGKEIAGAGDVNALSAHIRGHNMARGGVEAAVWDLQARRNGNPLWKEIGGGARREIPCGVSIGIQDSVEQLIGKIELELAAGYQRIKMKIKPGWDVDVIRSVRERFPRIRLMADANSAYTLADAARLKQLDEFYLMMIEQPLAHDDIIDHAALQPQLETPICLDECIRTDHHAQQAIAMKAGRIVNIKLGRVGGFGEAKRVHDTCEAAGIPVWCGGMLEAGIGRAHNIALATLANFTLPGDVSASNRYWKRDLISPAVEITPRGTIEVRDRVGFGYEIDHDFMKHVTVREEAVIRSAFTGLLRRNRNYRFLWFGQVVSEVGDHFNNIAVMSLAMQHANAGLVVTGVFLARAVPMLAAGPIAGVLLDRLDRRRVMIASDLTRAVLALAFILCVGQRGPWLLYALSAALMFASPFFTAGRNSILPGIATKDELHAANTMTQSTSWASLAIGAFLGAMGTQFGFAVAFGFNALSFMISALCVWQLKRAEGFKPERSERKQRQTGAAEYRAGIAYMRANPLVFGIAMLSVGWASGGGAAQILFSLFGEKVFNAGPVGIGIIWGFAGIGLLLGGAVAYRLGKVLTFVQYKRTIPIAYAIHGAAYVLFSVMPTMALACVFILISRAAIAVSSVLNTSQLLHHVEDRYRGRVFATLESLTWSTMMVSMMATGAATISYSPRTIGVWAGAISSTTAIFWTWANVTGRLPEPSRVAVPAAEEEELIAEPPVAS